MYEASNGTTTFLQDSEGNANNTHDKKAGVGTKQLLTCYLPVAAQNCVQCTKILYAKEKYTITSAFGTVCTNCVGATLA